MEKRQYELTVGQNKIDILLPRGAELQDDLIATCLVFPFIGSGKRLMRMLGPLRELERFFTVVREFVQVKHGVMIFVVVRFLSSDVSLSPKNTRE